jgi:hypothetical protein
VDSASCETDMHLWHLKGNQAAKTHSLGKIKGLERWMAIVKIALPWMGPLHGGKNWDCDKDAMMFLGLREDGRVFLVLPVPQTAGSTPYLISRNGEMVVSRSEGGDSIDVVLAIGNESQAVLDEGIKLYKHLVRKGGNTLPTIEKAVDLGVARVDKERDDWERGVGYCTWNSLGANLSHQKIMDALESLVKNDIKGTIEPNIASFSLITNPFSDERHH